jgi:hypothetical protein
MSSDERSIHPLCGARKKNGQICRAFAGQGTEHLGTGKCKYHGGSTRSHRKRGATVEAKRSMTKLGQSLTVQPGQALMGVLRATAGHVAWLNAEVGNLDGIDTPEARSLVDLYGQERDRLARVAKACLDSGISKLEVELAREQTELVAKAVNNALGSIGGLNSEQRKQFGKALRRELQQLERPTPTATPATGPQDLASPAVAIDA